ncbi:helix-turn-helix transcriptional regulator [Paenibacillus glycanilyticus]|uniref:HTH-type transcriptional regulator YfiF n=1 Tax=Paenibacillus glycanilyticus TaxID=126569 RepID=A0ABQ6GJ17_9BACL|nr:AraC family transcriptional regulator [Paenibacillus glycanilyticus]GLX70485.1 putative HTH-type transcriptional regulator YfiF [Paenibacillus glycanilyticus]
MEVELVDNGSRFLNEMINQCETSALTFRVHYWDWRQLHYSNHVHKHSFYEVCFVMSGEGEYQDEDIVYPLRAGSLFISRPGIWHQIRSEIGLSLIYVAYELDRMKSSKEEYTRYAAHLDKSDVVLQDAFDDRAIHYWLGLYHHASSAPYEEVEDLKRLAGILLASLPRPFDKENMVPSLQVNKPNDYARGAVLRQSKQYIRDNLSRPLKIEEVADYMNLSTRQLSRMFQLEGGDTFLTYLRNERLKLAEILLKTSISPLKEIAAHSGFQSVHYFTNVFTEQKGMPPGEYRRLHLGQHD